MSGNGRINMDALADSPLVLPSTGRKSDSLSVPELVLGPVGETVGKKDVQGSR
jgi:hypothetical protein